MDRTHDKDTIRISNSDEVDYMNYSNKFTKT